MVTSCDALANTNPPVPAIVPSAAANSRVARRRMAKWRVGVDYGTPCVKLGGMSHSVGSAV